MNTTVYAPTLVDVPTTIINGQDTSSVINSQVLPGFRGAGNLMGMSVPAGFVAGSMTFFRLNSDITDNREYPYSITDGVDTLIPSVVFTGGLQSVGLPPYWFSGIGRFKIKLDAAVLADTIIMLHFQPIFQGQNNV